MRLLRIEAEGLYLFNEKVIIDFFAEQRVTPKNVDLLHKVFNKTYTNNVLSFVGINASGKTLSLKLIAFIMKMMNADPINNISTKTVLDHSKNVYFKTYFFDDIRGICLLETEIEVLNNDNKTPRLVIKNERLYTRKIISTSSKNNIFSFDIKDLYKTRDESIDQQVFLKDDVSIVIALGKKDNIKFTELLAQTDINTLDVLGTFPISMIRFLDPSIEYIKYNHDKSEITLKFFRDETPISLNGIEKIKYYLSSGTIKGLTVFMNSWITLIEGGYIIIDEIENHFNKEIVSTLIRFFMDPKLNTKGSTLIYSTHYVELLDVLDRNDCIYVLNNKNKISLKKLNHILKRNDIKKSDAFESDILVGTAPSYDAYMKLKKLLMSGSIYEE